jgi:CubicO group peptidase (beta-lactamase class C family)
MIKRFSRLIALILLAFPFMHPAAHVQPAYASISEYTALGLGSSDDAKIREVTENLLPALQIKGRSNAMNLADRMRYHKIPGVSVAVINNGQIEWARGFGVLDSSTNQPVTADTLFQAGSISKSVASAAVLHLVEQGKLDLDENVNDKLKSWKAPDNQFTGKKKVTLREILSHTAGLTVNGFPGYATDVPLPTLTQVLDGAKPANTEPIRVDTEPGTIYRYSGGGYTIMQQLLIDVAGKPFPEILDQAVIARAKMTHSTYQQPLPVAWQARTATAHINGQPIKGRWHIYPEMAAAGLWTTPSDLALFAIAIQHSLAGESNALLSPSTAKLMVTPVKDGYALGLAIQGEGDSARFGHRGEDEGFEAQLTAYEKGGWGAVVMTNGQGGSALAQEIIRSIAKVYGWPGYPFPEKDIAQVDPRQFDDYAGRYSIGAFALTVRRDGSRLLVRGPDGIDDELYPEADGWFFTTDDGVELKFVRDAKGQVTAITARQEGQNFELKRVAGTPPGPPVR